MTDSELHPYVELIAREARKPVVVDPAARDRVMAAVRAEPVPQRQTSVWGRFIRPREFRLSPASGALLAAGLVGIGVLSGNLTNNRGGRPPVGYPTDTVAQRHPVSSVDTVVKFVYSAPQADKVYLVGDFNGWDTTKTPLARAGNGSWTVTIPLSAGRHLYGFVVDGSWNIDPHAPLAPDDGFGHANSVKLVRRGTSL
jgi:hypothetical protein